MPDPKPLAELILRNRSNNPIIIKRAQSGAEGVLDTYGVIGLKIWKDKGYLAIDWENRTVWMDLGQE
jgi:hypothetical protein